jgi:hypothetical protein
MKKMISLMMVLFFLGGMFPVRAASGVDPVSPVPKFKIKFCIELEFGKHGTAPACPGFGICYIHIILSPVNPHGLEINQADGEAYFEDDGHFVVEFKQSQLRTDTRDKYLSGTFLVEEDYELPQDVLNAGQFKGSYTIKAGKYNISEDGDILRIKF